MPRGRKPKTATKAPVIAKAFDHNKPALRPGRRGRKPTVATVEKRTELELLGQPDVKAALSAKAGFNLSSATKKRYSGLSEHVKFVIDLTALGYTKTSIHRIMKDKYGIAAEQVMSPSLIQDYQKRYFDVVMEREKELRLQIPILSPLARASYLQEVVNKALGGTDKTTRTGEKYTEYELTTVIAAVREAGVMAKQLEGEKIISTEENIGAKVASDQAETFRQYIDNQLEEGLTLKQIFDFLDENFSEEYPEAISRLKEEYDSRGQQDTATDE